MLASMRRPLLRVMATARIGFLALESLLVDVGGGINRIIVHA